MLRGKKRQEKNSKTKCPNTINYKNYKRNQRNNKLHKPKLKANHKKYRRIKAK
jgi:hypothetical protein